MLKFGTNTAHWNGRDLALTERQITLLRYMVDNPGFHKPETLYDVFQPNARDSSIESKRIACRTHIKRLRERFRSIDEKFNKIEVRFTIGYRWRG